MSADADLTELQFTVFGFVSRPPAEVYEAVADPAILSRYFTTGGAEGRLEPGVAVQWDFADFPGAFPVRVLEARAPERIVLRWDGDPATTQETDGTEVAFEFRPVGDGARTEVRVTERAWRPTDAGAEAAFGNCMGWTGMLAAMKAWLEYGINLREGFYA
ncbi:SRPBCC domain-containing protein [Leucobacter triazinivorans]|uniref:ATPase n=1 Tax=Leucobacter triazinivorans TaxID=1784719 RepID=A0A4P6KDD5_9MICO|nr:SRPBCC domain-containing protein [Leucobacter triazinivorans]QBE47888.1 ATPase [Leucobacter triazinivorans]